MQVKEDTLAWTGVHGIQGSACYGATAGRTCGGLEFVLCFRRKRSPRWCKQALTKTKKTNNYLCQLEPNGAPLVELTPPNNAHVAHVLCARLAYLACGAVAAFCGSVGRTGACCWCWFWSWCCCVCWCNSGICKKIF